MLKRNISSLSLSFLSVFVKLCLSNLILALSIKASRWGNVGCGDQDLVLLLDRSFAEGRAKMAVIDVIEPDETSSGNHR